MPFAPTATPSPVFIHSLGAEAVGILVRGANSARASTSWPANNRAHYVPFVISDPLIVYKMGWANGAAVSGNVDMGIFSENGVKLASTGATGQSGTNTFQVVTLGTPQKLAPGRYYMGISLSSTSGRLYCSPFTSEVGRAVGCAQEASAHPLPSSFTLAAAASGFALPHMYLQCRSAA